MHFGCKYYKCRIVPRVTVSETGASRSWNCSRRFLSCFTYLRQTCAHCFITCKWSKCIQLRRNNQRWASSIRRACQWAAVNISGRPSRHMQLSHSQIQKKPQKQIIFFNPTDLNDMCSFYLNLFRTSSYYSGQHIRLRGCMKGFISPITTRACVYPLFLFAFLSGVWSGNCILNVHWPSPTRDGLPRKSTWNTHRNSDGLMNFLSVWHNAR